MGILGRIFIWAFAWMAVCAVGEQASGDAQCAGCHEQGKKLTGSVHLPLGCQGCHGEHEKYPHPKNVEKPACVACHTDQAGAYASGVHGLARKKGNESAPDCAICHGDAHEMKAASSSEFRKAVPETCGMCHAEVSEQYRASVHGQALQRGVTASPLCTDCHGEHSILSPKDAKSPVNQGQIRETCGNCHGNVMLSRRFGLPADRIVSFDASFHGLASKSGSQSVANCASCHGIHNILPSSDAKATTNAKNLPHTCGQCHPGAGSRFALGTIHLMEGGKEPKAVLWARQFYLLVIPWTIGLMLLHNLGDWIRKLITLRFRWKAGVAVSASETYLSLHQREFRMYFLERAQHALLAVSFAVLVWTGFALKYPGAWWAWPLVIWESSWPVRGVVHRTAAAVMMVVAVFHFASLLVSRQLREHWKQLLPKPRDATEALLNFAYNLGFRSQRPKLSPHGYVEKAEYWAVAWGTLVMAATGVVLWANNLALQYLPKEWLDFATTVHFYEAVLATLAIVVWHIYTVIFDPDVYPVDTAWLNGFSVRRRESHDVDPAARHGGTDASADKW